jgi:two-component system LytT family response regulator
VNELTDRNFHIIFTTAYDQYAIKAIRYAAFDYLLKPVDIEELKIVISKVKGLAQRETRKQLELLQQNLLQPMKSLERLAIPTMEGLIFFEVNEIIHLEAQSNYTLIHFVNKTKMTVPKTLKEFEELLPEDIFFRVHHSHLINLKFIKRYIKGDGGQIELKNGKYVDVARRKKEEFLKVIGN